MSQKYQTFNSHEQLNHKSKIFVLMAPEMFGCMFKIRKCNFVHKLPKFDIDTHRIMLSLQNGF